jgi:hypothetical protein
VEKRHHLVKVWGASMVHDINPAQINAFALGRLANSCIVAQQSDTRDPITRAHRRRDDSAGIISLRQYDMLWPGGSTLANSLKDVHRKKQDLLTGLE